jgi:catechol 2,3-dioxygenase-like lactoylglutathione lyase family enzyme
MPEMTYTLLYVDDPLASARFYTAILGREPVELAPTFALFVMANGGKLGLWSRHTVEPGPEGAPGSTEIGFALENEEAVAAMHRDWTAKGVAIIQPPLTMDFGFTFTARDPDGHRLRVLALGEQP